MTTKTRTELENGIKAFLQLVESAPRDNQFDESARDLKAAYDCFVRAGFTEEQAWEIVKIQISK